MATLIAPAQVVDAPARTPLQFGLFSVLPFRENSVDRWRNGVKWETETTQAVDGIGQWYYPTSGVNEIQTITLGGSGLTGWTISFGGNTTSSLAPTATAAQVQAALVALPSIGAGGVTVTGNAGGPYTVEFINTRGKTNQASMTTTPTGGTGTATVATTQNGTADEALPTGLPKNVAPLAHPLGVAGPFSLYGHYACSPMDRPADEMRDLATSHLVNGAEERVEQALWTGDLGQVPNFAAANGMAAPYNVGSFAAADIKKAVATLEQYLARNYGAVGVLHMSRYNVDLLDPAGVDAKAGKITTKLGTQIVAGSGYGDTKIIATGAMLAYRSEIFYPSDIPYDLLDRAKNNMVSVAEQEYVVGFDPAGFASATITA